MLYFHKELKEKLRSDYQIQKAVSNKEYFKIENGLYSDVEFVNPLEIICKKYPEAVFTSDSAYYYYDLTDVIPDYFYLATKRSDTRINNKNIKQIFIPNDLFDFGKTQIEIENIIISIYDEERMLVENISSFLSAISLGTILAFYYPVNITKFQRTLFTTEILNI